MASTRNGDLAALVVGAGPTGLTMASQLRRNGLSCRLVDKLAAPSGNSRALGIQARTLEVFDNLGIVDQVIEQGLRVHGLNMWLGSRRMAHIAFDELDSPFPYIIDLPQAQTETILRKYLATFGVQPEWGVELTSFTQDGEGVTATLRHADGRDETVRAAWLVGCDRAHSATRPGLGWDFAGSGREAAFAVGDVRVEWSLPHDELHVFLHPDGLLAAFPFGKDRQRLTVETDQLAAEGAKEPTLADFQRWLDERGPGGATVDDPRWLTPFRISFRHAPHYRQGRAFIAGDAGHIHSPAGGQGMNTCIQDAFNLAWKLALVHKSRAPEALLDSYEVERKPVAEGVLRMTQVAGKVAATRGPLADELRQRLLPLLADQEVIQQRMVRWVSELPVNYRQSPIVAEHGGGFHGRRFHGGPRPGERAPDATPLEQPDGATVRLFDVLRGTRHTLLLFAGHPPASRAAARLADAAAAVDQRHADLVQVVRVAAEAPAAGDAGADA